MDDALMPKLRLAKAAQFKRQAAPFTPQMKGRWNKRASGDNPEI
jgi:hypothetical protein